MDKLKNINHVIYVHDPDLATQILKSKKFEVSGLLQYLKRLSTESDIDLNVLARFISNSPFFVEGNQHTILRQHLWLVFGSKGLSYWEPQLLHEIKCIIAELPNSGTLNLAEVSFSLFKRLLRPIIGLSDQLPEDFDLRLFKLQKLVEPVLAIRELVHLQNELIYLMNCIKEDINNKTSFPEHSLLASFENKEATEFSDEDKVLLTLVSYGATSPLVQTLGNLLLKFIQDPSKSIFRAEGFHHEQFKSEVEYWIYRETALNFILRVAKEDFQNQDNYFSTGQVVLIVLQDTFNSQVNECPHSIKNLGFGFGSHYCIGNLFAKFIISEFIPKFFERFPTINLINWQYDNNNHTARSLETLIVEVHENS